MIFDYKLVPWEKIEPWTGKQGFMLSWYGLTDGCYRLQVGEEKLFSYAPPAVEFYEKKYAHPCRDYVDYTVARLWEDVCDLLPEALNPIPDELAYLLSGPQPPVVEWLKKIDLKDWLENNRYDEGTEWLRVRGLDSLYLKNGPRVWVWSDAKNVTFTWDNRSLEIEGVTQWSAQHGTFSLPREDFIKEVEIFHRSLIDQMGERVREICAGWNRPEIKIDFDELRTEQNERAEYLTQRLVADPQVRDWDEVIASVRYISNRSGIDF